MRIFKRSKPTEPQADNPQLGGFFDGLLKKQTRKHVIRNPFTGEEFDPWEKYPNPTEPHSR
jgi:hypothetical protein